mmetsp:Transcript_40225/g.65181  ORF Transcript_40225/g.65181 Transcript_40225/m.65181 type:complete len:247 (-) Transcript_40225:1316-2056(-)
MNEEAPKTLSTCKATSRTYCQTGTPGYDPVPYHQPHQSGAGPGQEQGTHSLTLLSPRCMMTAGRVKLYVGVYTLSSVLTLSPAARAAFSASSRRYSGRTPNTTSTRAMDTAANRVHTAALALLAWTSNTSTANINATENICPTHNKTATAMLSEAGYKSSTPISNERGKSGREDMPRKGAHASRECVWLGSIVRANHSKQAAEATKQAMRYVLYARERSTNSDTTIIPTMPILRTRAPTCPDSLVE